jgi:hypothetical protein
MPNSLAHLGIQGLVTRSVLRNADLKWIYLGCLIPDVPWILQRALRILLPELNRYELYLYSGVQSSLFFCLILSAALALIARRSTLIFLILSISSLLHLLLDASQIKWANGVLLAAPFDWRLISFGFYWPESLMACGLTFFGLIYFLVMWKRVVSPPLSGFTSKRLSLFIAFMCLLSYAGMPFLFRQEMLVENNYYIRTLQAGEERTGKMIAFDRVRLIVEKGRPLIQDFNDELYEVDGLAQGLRPSTISLKGRFTVPGRIDVSAYHIHPTGMREMASLIGIALIGLYWLRNVLSPAPFNIMHRKNLR